MRPVPRHRGRGLWASGRPLGSGPGPGRGALVALVAVLLAGCVNDGPSTVTWQVDNHSDERIEYHILLEGDGPDHEASGALAPGASTQHEMRVTGTDFTATVRLEDDPRASAGVPFAIDGLCSDPRIDAAWDGERWRIDVAATECQ